MAYRISRQTKRRLKTAGGVAAGIGAVYLARRFGRTGLARIRRRRLDRELASAKPGGPLGGLVQQALKSPRIRNIIIDADARVRDASSGRLGL